MRDRQQVNIGKDQHHTHTQQQKAGVMRLHFFMYVSSCRATRPILELQSAKIQSRAPASFKHGQSCPRSRRIRVKDAFLRACQCFCAHSQPIGSLQMGLIIFWLGRTVCTPLPTPALDCTVCSTVPEYVVVADAASVSRACLIATFCFLK